MHSCEYSCRPPFIRGLNGCSPSERICRPYSLLYSRCSSPPSSLLFHNNPSSLTLIFLVFFRWFAGGDGLSGWSVVCVSGDWEPAVHQANTCTHAANHVEPRRPRRSNCPRATYPPGHREYILTCTHAHPGLAADFLVSADRTHWAR